jgi:hypothetical protein
MWKKNVQEMSWITKKQQPDMSQNKKEKHTHTYSTRFLN